MKRLLLITLFILSGCATSHNKTSYTPYKERDARSVFVVKYDWHSGVVLKKSEIPADIIPEKDDFPNAEFLEIGWGNKAFYQEPKFKLSLAAKALFLPGPSTMYLNGFNGAPEVEYDGNRLVKLQFTPDKYHHLLEKIDKSFDRKGQKRAESTLPGFYDAFGSYGIFSTCNMWTARVLNSGGAPISTSVYSATARNVMSQISPYGTVLLPTNDVIGN